MVATAAQHRTVTVGVVSDPPRTDIPRVLELAQRVIPVRFECRAAGEYHGLAGVILLGGSIAEARTILSRGLRCLHFLPGTFAGPELTSENISFTDAEMVPAVLRGRTIANEVFWSKLAVNAGVSSEILAAIDGHPVWSSGRGAEGAYECSGLALPVLRPDEGLLDVVNRARFAQLLPLLCFLRTVAGESRWSAPPLRACLMFDDPNLHWKTYGYIDYAKLARHAREHRYHVALATVPLDGWFIHQPTAKLFNGNGDVLSLLVHGNNHTEVELARSYNPHERIALLKQALARVERVEARSGCRIARVMAAPHGACLEEMMGDMAAVGFEAACISLGSLRYYNQGRPWTAALGLALADVVAGLPVLPRFPMNGDWRNNVLLSALLGRPIIAVGHHQDVRRGLDRLAEMAGFINSLGQVEWLDMERIAHSNYSWCKEGTTLRARMHSRRIRLALPAGTKSFAVENRASLNGGSDQLWWIPAGANGAPTKLDQSSAVNENAKVEVFASSERKIEPSAPYPLGAWPVARRLLSEARDRVCGWIQG